MSGSLNITLLLFFITAIAFLKCASPRGLSGGPTDSLPPLLLSSDPAFGSLNVDGKEFILTFNEAVNAQQLKQQLIITPYVNNNYTFVTKKEKLTLRFDDPFPDSTTISFNFSDGVTDITENNPSENLRLVFSTGTYLDSMSVSGAVRDLLKQTPVNDALVGLYQLTDTLNPTQEKPQYFNKTNEEGIFLISNIKAGQYKLLGFVDNNRNLLFDPASEAHGFLSDPINLDTPATNLLLNTVTQDASALRMISSRSLGQYFDISYSKAIISQSIQPYFFHKFDAVNNILRLYQPATLTSGDSLNTYITVSDSLGNTLTDTLYVKFSDNLRRPEEFRISPRPIGNVTDSLFLTIDFNQPVVTYALNSINLSLDSIADVPIDTFAYEWNYAQTRLNLKIPFDTADYYALQRSIIANDTTLNRRVVKRVSLSIPKGTFISAMKDTSLLSDVSFNMLSQSDKGLLIVNFSAADSLILMPSTVQVIDRNFIVKAEQTFNHSMRFTTLGQGEYTIRLLFSTNERPGWDLGNYVRSIPPDKVRVYPTYSTLRANWEVMLDIDLQRVDNW